MRRAQRQHHGDLRALFSGRLGDDDLRRLVEIWGALDPAADPTHG